MLLCDNGCKCYICMHVCIPSLDLGSWILYVRVDACMHACACVYLHRWLCTCPSISQDRWWALCPQCSEEHDFEVVRVSRPTGRAVWVFGKKKGLRLLGWAAGPLVRWSAGLFYIRSIFYNFARGSSRVPNRTRSVDLRVTIIYGC